MIALRAPTPLIDRLPAVRGRLSADVALAPVTWFRVGGPAEAMFKPADAQDLADFLAGRPRDVAVRVIGVASNLLVRDGGVPGVVIRLGRAFTGVEVVGETLVCGASALDATVAKVAEAAGLAGLEFLSGIPGTLGGALRMNAGAHLREMADIVVLATAVDGLGQSHTLTPAQMGFSYRACALPEDWIFTGCVLAGRPDERGAIAARMEALRQAREASQPLRARTGGSTFANPDPDLSGGRRAWELIDAAGCRGLRLGGAQVSEKHCNFLINTGEATAADLEALGETVRRRVMDTSGVALRWEIKRIGIGLDGLSAGENG
ncbi:UDP-N-acetylmuramate dehydrogenase [Rhodospirillum rubrum]|uniref:UDP-N-acetylenolpyruvoylglucosamine reductase n=1 Tax=Rhodospirillum rubrum (strain ATCC 11170 / ATH 1.1.1 / DSM 467 / LMG 4362 / NCIMB 8255 / S1) TaxID=269796 RepID=MURB_RHORT|nr:UDP-N-acetylmuramate dehydrogenase [Rhodospirillum rubrum]Q2RVU6.1 RecName: Full=UDP-N-acetylenolpyruvoylglucosamine reductase; AltName: Full=UDP-N-acetylmuramate dehydrogenase [Rhodospirillum rubrum ATCC 11170]ABC21749.1 UDP-N-acetylmuramate dehydrogenase [Rhodospirillum rubrum ATCC 11170]AEO47447.1 UDP-N-acetylenolpyruvoylglucosamine reductase [Rhodospirillum rubrum F11]MBK5953306.1 UDP-N-acetylenolpyruvoylglucosamine reductase [Rhodospirillum rubrum]QXG81411.1 UDP-N-acetylmuramate dehydr